MKTIYYALAIMLMIFTSCEKKKPNEAQQMPPKKQNSLCNSKPHTSFNLDESSLKLVNGDTEIEAKLMLKTESPDFEYGGYFKIVESNGRKAIAFMYNKHNNTQEPDDENEEHTIAIEFKFNNPYHDGTNTYQFNDEEPVRIIPFNESDPAIFNGLEKFFMLKLYVFGDQIVYPEENKTLVKTWNFLNPGNIVNTQGDIGIEIPRVTKDDGVLSLKR